MAIDTDQKRHAAAVACGGVGYPSYGIHVDATFDSADQAMATGIYAPSLFGPVVPSSGWRVRRVYQALSGVGTNG